MGSRLYHHKKNSIDLGPGLDAGRSQGLDSAVWNKTRHHLGIYTAGIQTASSNHPRDSCPFHLYNLE